MRLVVNNDEDELATILHASRRRARNGDLPNRGVITIADEDILNYESSVPWSPTEAPSRKKGKKASSRGGDRNNESTGPSPEGSSKLTHPARSSGRRVDRTSSTSALFCSIKLNPLATFQQSTPTQTQAAVNKVTHV